MMAFDVGKHLPVHPFCQGLPFRDGGSDFGGRDVEKRRVNDLDRCGQRRFVEFASRSSVNENLIPLDDFICMIPSGELFPIVGTNHQGELMFWIRFL